MAILTCTYAHRPRLNMPHPQLRVLFQAADGRPAQDLWRPSDGRPDRWIVYKIYMSPERQTTCCQGTASGSLPTQSPGRPAHLHAGPLCASNLIFPCCMGKTRFFLLFFFWICAPRRQFHCIVDNYGHYQYAGFCTCFVCFEPSCVRGTWMHNSVSFSWCVFTQSQPGIRQISPRQCNKQHSQAV